MRTLLPLLVFLLPACGSGSDDGDKDCCSDTDPGGGGDVAHDFAYFVNVTTPWTGNTDTCIDGRVQEVDPSCIVDLDIEGEVLDFQKEEPVENASVRVWFGDDIGESADVTTTADVDGNFTMTAPSCTPVAYQTLTPPEWEQTKDTYEFHQVFAYSDDGSSDEAFNSVSDATSRLIPSLIGVLWDESTGIIAGKAYDCDTEPMQYVQVFLHDASGNPPASAEVFYFSESGGTSLPTDKESQPYTNTNGLWVAMNVPAGTWTVETWGYDADAGTQVMLGATELEIPAGSVSISNIYTGVTDGIWYPESCLSACGG